MIAADDERAHQQRIILRNEQHRKRQQRVAQDRAAVNKCALRAARLSALEGLQAAEGVPLAPDGAAPVGPALIADAAGGGVETERALSCYICKRRFASLHAFYDRLCPPCAALNFSKRNQSAKMDGLVALVTGARVKIGPHPPPVLPPPQGFTSR